MQKKRGESEYELYEKRNIILPIPREENKKETMELKENEEKSLEIVNETIFEKVKIFLRKIFWKE